MQSDVLERLSHGWRDVRHAWGSLARQPTLAVLAIFTIALGTAATTAVISVRSALLARPLAVTDPDSLHLVDELRVLAERTADVDTGFQPLFLELGGEVLRPDPVAAGRHGRTADRDADFLGLRGSTAGQRGRQECGAKQETR